MTPTRAPAVDLATLLAALDDARTRGAVARRVTGIAYDSRRIAPGDLFVALPGERVDGHAFVRAALAAGASAVVVANEFDAADLPSEATVVAVPETRRAFSRLAAAFYGDPSAALRVAGVTGTNGKTTTTHFIASILDAAGLPCGRIGTLGAQFGGAMWPLENTTPLAADLQATLAAMLERGARGVAMEVSSHALALGRVADVRFAVAVLTNVTRDHLDFHHTFEEYALAKRSLFERTPKPIFNLDDPLGRRWAAEFGAGSCSTYGFGAEALVRAGDVTLDARGSSFVVDGARFELRLPGRFNVANALAALAVARALGVDEAASVRGLAAVDRVPGRMEHLGDGAIDVLVDYAHTPDALERVLQAVRETSRGRLLVVFGCGGDRDRGKRPEMGRVAAQSADQIFVTSDNPRSEDPRAIVDAIVAGIPAGRAATVEVDRAAAIKRAISEAHPGDVVVVAGKGHETYQILGARTIHFDDRDVVRAALAERARSIAR